MLLKIYDDGGTIFFASTLNKVRLSDIHNFVKQKSTKNAKRE